MRKTKIVAFHSWETGDINIEPDRNLYPELGFAISDTQKPSTLAVLVEGRFESFFKGKESPLLVKDTKVDAQNAQNESPEKDKKADVVTSVIDKSSNTARLILFASNEFISDETLQISGMLSGTQYINPLQLVENSIDWSVQDRTLLSIRTRGHFARTLEPLSEDQKRNWEVFNYIFALLGLLATWGGFKYVQRKSRRLYKALNIA
jgi:ABC-2 type transport system permease protein